MSTPRELTLDPAVRCRTADTARGTFAALVCEPSSSGLAKGSALLIPGFTGSKEDFAALLPLLAAVGWAVATYDQRGQYESAGRADDDYTLAGYAADASAVTDTLLGTSEQVHIVGHSFGGLVAATAVVAQPARWASLTVMCSGPGGLPAGASREEALAAADAIPRDGLEACYRTKLARDAAHGRPEPAPDIAAFLRRRFLTNTPASLAAIARLLADAPDRTADLACLDVPIRVLRGADDDAWPHAVQDAFATAVGTRVEVIAGAAHSPAVEQPEATRDALVRGWLS
ncbi:MAG: alpha/beta fold hydrolase [Nocardioidaceae bacterium]